MKNFISICLFFTLSFLSINVLAVNSATHSGTASSTQLKNASIQVETSRITKRISEINAMRSGNISASERSNLKKELRGMKKYLSGPGTGVYLSTSALILIIILLIILL
ncbi:MAG: hypothetical protein NTW54_02350 [Bacteroidetes bacterium]|nr:hypothetical protein [Bacteroidota bacterium]